MARHGPGRPLQGGRPSYRAQVILSDEQRETLAQAAEAAEMTLSAYIRQAALEQAAREGHVVSTK